MHAARLLSLALASLCLALLPALASAAPAPRAKWTVMVYISGDNNLEDYVVKDIELELAALGSTPNVQIVALADRGPGFDTSYGDWQTTKLFHVTQGMKADAASAVTDWGERNMGDKQSLIDFVTWSKTNFPADHYALYLWGHGWNWHPGYVMEDSTSHDTLDSHEIKAALPALGFIDVVGFDGCNMASIEVMKLWNGYATAISASQEYVNWNGIEYDVVIDDLTANPNMTADQVAVSSSQSAIIEGGERTWAAIAVDARVNALLTATDQFGTALRNGLAANRKKYDAAFTATRNMWQAPMDKDLYDMAFEINARVSDATIKSRAQAVMNAVHGVVLWAGHTNAYSDVRGITINHISKAAEKASTDWSYYRTNLDFSLTTQWDEFLDAYAK